MPRTCRKSRWARYALVLASMLAIGCGAGQQQQDGTAAGGDAPAAGSAEVSGADSAEATGAGSADVSGAGSAEVSGADYDGPRGLVTSEPGVSDGYVLFGPLLSDTTFLIDNDGLVVHTWKSEYAPSGSAYLLANGNLLRGGRDPETQVFSGGGQGGILEEFTWEGEKVWEFEYAGETHLLHHDIEVLPGGNILAIAWEAKTAEEARRAGRDPATTPEGGLWPDKVIEIEPTRPEGGRIVWEWRVWDHLVQDFDESLPNYGDPSEHPGRIDVNAGSERPEMSPEELEQLKALGYMPQDAQLEEMGSDWLHTNSVAYNAELDQIALSTPSLSEIWIIDHGTTTEEAAGSSGGRRGKGGDLLYRWGNPAAYGRGTEEDQQLFAQHDVRWIPDGFPGAGNLTLFNNSVPDPDGDGEHSAVIEIAPPVDERGAYVLPEGGTYGPDEPVWRHRATAGQPAFHSPFISGAVRLPNGNTLICSGAPGRIFEVTPEGEIVWDFRDPHSGDVRLPDGSTPQPVGEFTYAIFRAARIPPDHPGLAGVTLAPLDPQPSVADEQAAGS